MTKDDSYVPGKVRFEEILEPVSGKAVELSKGEVLRIEQTEGEQCVDFNAFNLRDGREQLSVGHSRRQGFRVREGDFLYSTRLRPLLFISRMSKDCATDLLGARCNLQMFRGRYGFDQHTNCQDTLSASIAPYGLTPDDVHDSFNIWMNTAWDSRGRVWTEWNTAPPGDVVELVACTDVLAVPVVCGSGDANVTSNFFLRPIKISVLEASGQTMEVAGKAAKGYVRRGPWSSFVDPERELEEATPLTRNDDIEPRFIRYPLQTVGFEVKVPQELATNLDRLVERGFGRDQTDAARKAFMMWYLRNEATHTDPGRQRLRW